MKRTFIYMLCLLVVAGGLSSCKKVVEKERSRVVVYKDGTKVEKYYKLTPPAEGQVPEPEKEKEVKPKRLFECKAKQILRDQLRKDKEERLVAPIRVGYYECNDYQERLNLYKLAANNVINLKCDEIVTPYGSTYWVTVDLTLLGWWYKEDLNKKLFPEDRIDMDEARAFLSPKWDQDAWGIPTTDTIVPRKIVEAMKTFYSGLQQGQSYNQSLMDAKMVCAMSLLNTLASYGVNKIGYNPFTRGLQLTPQMVSELKVLRMPRLQNAYLVTLGENSFLYVINDDVNVNVMIEDLAYIDPAELRSYDQTVCSLAGKLTKAEILQAREAKRLRDKLEAQMRAAMAKSQPKEEPANPEDDFEMCATSGSLMLVEHTDPTLYELAKKAEHFEVVMLLGGVVKVNDIDELNVEGDKKHAWASADAIYKTCRVNAVGRIYLGLTDGEKDLKKVNFEYTKKDGWKLSKDGQSSGHKDMKPCDGKSASKSAQKDDDDIDFDFFEGFDF